jgi:hypothetical protein
MQTSAETAAAQYSSLKHTQQQQQQHRQKQQ